MKKILAFTIVALMVISILPLVTLAAPAPAGTSIGVTTPKNKAIVGDELKFTVNAKGLVSVNIFEVNATITGGTYVKTIYGDFEGDLMPLSNPTVPNYKSTFGADGIGAMITGDKKLMDIVMTAAGASGSKVNVTLNQVEMVSIDAQDVTSAYFVPMNPASAAVTVYENARDLANVTDITMGDKAVTLEDLSLAMGYYTAARDQTVWNERADRCDLNCDGIVDMADLIMILQYKA